MGCLTSIIKKIIIIALIIAFFAFGGWAFLKDKINDYQNPPRNVFVEQERDWADFSLVSGDYQLCRNFNIFGYKKISAKYLPTGQKITIFDLKDEKRVSVNDFKTREIDKKIETLLNTFKDSFITFEDFKIIQRGSYLAHGKTVPFIVFEAKVRNVPFKNVTGTIACYSTINTKSKNPSTKLIVSIVDKKAQNPKILSDFINSLKF